MAHAAAHRWARTMFTKHPNGEEIPAGSEPWSRGIIVLVHESCPANGEIFDIVVATCTSCSSERRRATSTVS